MEHFYFNRIFPNIDDTSGIRIAHKVINPDKPLCVFGVLTNKRGLKIEEEMLEWLSEGYDVYCVYQEYPGKYYEYPALRFMQYHMLKHDIPYGLYIHTKGAFNVSFTQDKVRRMWEKEFTKNKKKYIDSVLFNKNSVITPLSGIRGETWFNAFFASKEAMSMADLERPVEDRYYYERLFKDVSGVKVIGVVRNLLYPGEALQSISKY